MADEVKKEEKKVSVSPKLAKIIEEVETLTVLELADLVKALEEKFGVSATAAAVAPVAVGNGGQVTDAEEKTEQTVFNVLLKSSGANKISVIKALRELNQSLGLKEAKDLVDAAPKEVMSQVDKKTAEEAKKKLETAGAAVELK